MKWLGAFLMFGLPFLLFGQDSIPPNWAFNGYLSDMLSAQFQSFNNDVVFDNLVHNRLNFKYYNSSNTVGATFEIRNRWIYGESVQNTPNYADLVNYDDGCIALSTNILSKDASVFNAKVDRAYFDFTKDKLQVRVGRQRINWGQCFTWNPNDIFNAYSYFDFDYIEKPGCDAIRLQYYGSSTSTIDFSIKANQNWDITSAILYRFNQWNYDFQFLGGLFNGEDYVVGAGWSGNLIDAGVRGEISYFYPMNSDNSPVFIASLGSDYTFKNSFLLQFEMLYNQQQNSEIKSFYSYFGMSSSVKQLSITEYSLMLQGSYPFTPLINISLAGIAFPKLKGYFIGPTISYSLMNNLDLSLINQLFINKTVITNYYNFFYLRLKWNF